MDTDFLARLNATPVVVVDLPTRASEKIARHNRVLAAFETLSGIPTKPVTSIQEWDELEERLGVLLG